MDDATQVRVILENHETRIDMLERALVKLEATADSIHDMSLSINKLAINMENMLVEQKEQGERIKTLEAKPIETWSTIKKTILTALVSAVAGAIIASVIAALKTGV